jgi:hypothetical protein
MTLQGIITIIGLAGACLATCILILGVVWYITEGRKNDG